MIHFDLNKFISEHITKREFSLFSSDLKSHYTKLQKEIKGKKVLVIGGAGTIGSNFIKQTLKFEPGQLHVVDTNENGLTELTRDIRSTKDLCIPGDYLTYPMDFGSDVFYSVFLDNEGYDIVANFAAHKHVRSEKDIYAIRAMITNNVIKAQQLLELMLQYKPEHYFCVSTDKAANPVNVMGASKKLMEELVMSYSGELKITTARFANVAFSNGSLLDGYLHRVFKNQPLSCPSDVKRYFVSPEESGQICLMACILGKSGEIFYPKLQEAQMLYFKEITEDFIKNLGYEVDICQTEEEAKSKSIKPQIEKYPVYFFKTDTSGEKLYEEFYSKSDVINEEKFDSLGIITNSSIPSKEYVLKIIQEFNSLSNSQSSKDDAISKLKKFLPNFSHIETGKSLDQKM